MLPKRGVRRLFLLLSLTTNFDEPISMQSGEQTKLLLLLQSKKKEEEEEEEEDPKPFFSLLQTHSSHRRPSKRTQGFSTLHRFRLTYGSAGYTNGGH